jgi:hypothetical protein
MLQFDPAKRISAENAMKHPYFKDLKMVKTAMPQQMPMPAPHPHAHAHAQQHAAGPVPMQHQATGPAQGMPFPQQHSGHNQKLDQ